MTLPIPCDDGICFWVFLSSDFVSSSLDELDELDELEELELVESEDLFSLGNCGVVTSSNGISFSMSAPSFASTRLTNNRPRDA